ncbi:MAG: lasso peptide biosynthesis B2 protein [Candidatus Rokuibacteriota bacterium]|nr:MAG: lasso peptide biosynthesis B2 protein [Candidatus Rokubacteria bacterium]
MLGQSLVARLRRFLRLSGADQKVLLETCALLLAVQLGLSLLPFQIVRRFMLGHVGTRRRQPPMPPERIGWAVSTAGRLVPRATCLPQAVVAEGLLKRMGYQAALHIGVARGEGPALSAHAWVECLGRVVVGARGVTEYVVLGPAQPTSGRR